MIRTLILFAALLVPAATVPAQTPAAYNGPVAVVVAIPIPAGLTRPLIEAQFGQLVPAFQRIPGLKQKYFTVNDGKAGGIYLFVNRAAADAFFTDNWRAGVAKTYGTAPEVTFFDAPIVIQGPAGMKAE
jgi:hypothetical protein